MSEEQNRLPELKTFCLFLCEHILLLTVLQNPIPPRSQCHTADITPYLRSDVVRSTAEGLGCHPVPHVLLAHAKISYLYMPF